MGSGAKPSVDMTWAGSAAWALPFIQNTQIELWVLPLARPAWLWKESLPPRSLILPLFQVNEIKETLKFKQSAPWSSPGHLRGRLEGATGRPVVWGYLEAWGASPAHRTGLGCGHGPFGLSSPKSVFSFLEWLFLIVIIIYLESRYTVHTPKLPESRGSARLNSAVRSATESPTWGGGTLTVPSKCR